jgi:NAD(P)H-hydrate repair Nnr-like enzyme with NAD(P)H-hydrate dehydratase domain
MQEFARVHVFRNGVTPKKTPRGKARAAAAAAFVHARAANASAADPGPVSVPTSASRILTHIRHAIATL